MHSVRSEVSSDELASKLAKLQDAATTFPAEAARRIIEEETGESLVDESMLTGILSPILTCWISAKAGSAQGWELGKLTASASLGLTLGSAAGGLLFNITALPGASFVLTAGLAVLGFLLSLGLPRLLVLR